MNGMSAPDGFGRRFGESQIADLALLYQCCHRAYSILNWGIGSVVLALLAIGVAIMGLTPPDFQVAKFCFSLVVLLVLIRFGAWLIIAQWPISRKVIIAVIICGAIGAIWALLIGWVECREKAIVVRPVLRIRPVTATVQLEWIDKTIFPSKHDGKSPFSFILTNIGNARAIDVEMVFRAPLGIQEIQAELQSSGVFPGFDIKDDKVTVPLQFGKQFSRVTLPLGSDDVRAIDSLDFESGHNEKFVEYPLKTQNGLIIWLVSRSYNLGQVRHSKWIQDMQAQEKLFKEKGQIKWTEMWAEYNLQKLQQRQREGVLVCPEITVTISYKDVSGHNFSETPGRVEH